MQTIKCSYGVEVGQLTSDDLSNYPLVLPYLAVFYVEKGEVDFNIDFKNFSLYEGGVVVGGEDNIVSLSNPSDDVVIAYYFVERDFASNIAYVLPNELFGYLHYNPVMYLDSEKKRAFAIWRDLFLYCIQLPNLKAEKIICNQFQSLFLIMTEWVCFNEFVIEKNYSCQEELCWKFWDLITQYSKEYREVSFYADKLSITPYYLSQISKEFLHYSPKELINRQVVLNIKHYLANTDLSVSQIADEMNFVDPSYLGRFFKRETNLNPLEFRKK
ncbi:helix-turn-helix domain-containing protein [Myroides albus]|uniref:Helix-turn-helix domain-containing protein n=1 Tax=Myroides albus TaxID=2562892 RepID=A0A6I3LHL7_9FLAO|nr:helix-turn-helix domain-containing protein [Myroides albus]MTG97076.1 helix-turn-helix domain-containing protein [Myroides albus]UVD78501.1 helix-turn-helix domain-containing protein [Myroides albus]